MDTTQALTIDELAAAQAGHLTRTQLLNRGFHRSTVWHWVDWGSLIRVGAATFRLPSVARSVHGDALAACLDLGGVASHWTAAGLHGLVPVPRVVDVMVRRPVAGALPKRVSSQQPKVRLHTSTNLPDDDILLLGAVPVTSVARVDFLYPEVPLVLEPWATPTTGPEPSSRPIPDEPMCSNPWGTGSFSSRPARSQPSPRRSSIRSGVASPVPPVTRQGRRSPVPRPEATGAWSVGDRRPVLVTGSCGAARDR